jgi:hypothetical protein
VTLQDEVVDAFIRSGMNKVTQDLAGEEPVDHRIEAPIGEGWVDILVRTKSKQILFEVKTNVRVTQDGRELHEVDMGRSIRQLKKYAASHPNDIVSIMFPAVDASKWAEHFANEGINVVTWNATRLARCRYGCELSVRGELVLPHVCYSCGGKGQFQTMGLQQPEFAVYRAVPFRERTIDTEDKKNYVRILLEDEVNLINKTLGHEFNWQAIPDISLVLWRSISTSGQLTQIGLNPVQFRAITNFYTHIEHYSKQFGEMIGLTIGSHEYSSARGRLEAVRQTILDEIPRVREVMGWN